MGKPVVPIVMILVNVALGSIGQILLKKGAMLLAQLPKGQGIAAGLMDSFKGIFTPYVFLGFCVYALSSVLWIRILRQVNLSFAYPLISLSYVLVVILSAALFHEKVPWLTAFGLAFICIGVSLIGMGYGAIK